MKILYQPLSGAEMTAIHETALRILEEIGVAVSLEQAISILRSHGARMDDGRAYIPPSLVEKALAVTPRTFLMGGRDAKNDLHIGSNHVYLGTGGAALTVLDLDSGVARPGTIRDIADLARLVDALENIHFYLRPCVPQNLPAETADLIQFYAALKNTTKNVMAGVFSPDAVREVIEMAAMIAGGRECLQARPFISFVTSCLVSPLQLGFGMTSVLLEVAKNHIPVALSSAPMAGSTSPATLAGTLAQVHAEQLSAIVLTQLAYPGAPVLYGAIPSLTDFRTMSYLGGGIESGVMNAAAAQMARFIGVPNYNSGGLTEAKTPDAQAGYEKAFSICLTAMAGSNFIHHAAGMLEAMRAVAYEQYVIDNEIIGMALRLLRGIEINNETLAFEVIRECAGEGNFAAASHTVKFMRQQYFRPTVADRESRETWELAGSLDTRARARQKAKDILRTHRPVGIDDVTDREIRRRFNIRLPIDEALTNCEGGIQK
jgi:trimethylamine--corrinoid protein Co-methyltransferase